MLDTHVTLQDASKARAVEYRVLGPLEVTRDDVAVPVNGPKQRALLIFLLLHANQVLSTDRIVDALWGEEANGREIGTLRVHVANLRKTLEPDRPSGAEPAVLITQPPGYLLRADAEEIDSHRFESLVTAGRRQLHSNPDRACELLSEALGLWQGSPLHDVAYETFAQAEIHRLDELRLSATEDLNEARLAKGEHSELIGELESAVTAHSLRERLWGQLMLALFRSGRQADALTAYQRVSDILAQSGLEPGLELRLLEERVLVGDPSLLTPNQQIGPHRLPPAERSTLIGRQHDLAELRSRFADTRLLTLTGSGGVGKTRLAQRLAWMEVEELAEVWWVELSELTDPQRIPEQIAAAGGLSQGPGFETVQLLLRLIRTRELVIVLDSCEHVIDAAAHIVDRLLAGAPEVRFLTTSREPLQVEGEVVWRVSSLATPDPATPTDELAEYPSVEMFIERTVARGVSLTPESLPEVAVICRRLDGIPLALELAAARTSTLTPAEISQRLADRFSLLERSGRTAIARHRTLEAALDWSFQLLDAADQRLLSRLAVFVASFDRSAARQVCAFDPLTERDVETGLERLVEKSLIEPTNVPSGRRFRLTESVRALAWDRLPDEREPLLSRYRNWALQLAVVGSREVLRDEDVWLPRLEASHEDLREGFNELVQQGEIDGAVRLVGSLGGYLMWRRTNEALKWLEGAMAIAEASPEKVRPSTRAVALLALGGFLCYHNRLSEGQDHFADACDLYTDLGHTEGLVWVHFMQSYFPSSGDIEESIEHAREAYHLASQLTDPAPKAYAVARLAETLLLRIVQTDSSSVELETVIELCHDALDHCKTMPRPIAAAMARVALGHALALRGDGNAGLEMVNQGVEERTRYGGGIPCALELVSAGQLAFRLGHESKSRTQVRRGLAALKDLGIMPAVRPALVSAADILGKSAPEVAARIVLSAEQMPPSNYLGAVIFDDTSTMARLRSELAVDSSSIGEPEGLLEPEGAIELALAHL